MGDERHCEVVVVGGGPAGSASAALLADAGHDVVLVDRARFPRRKPCAEYVSPGAVAILERLGAFAFLDANVGRRLRGMEIRTPSALPHLVQYREDGRPARSLSISRYHLDAALLRAARARGVRVLEGFRVAAVLTSEGAVSGVVGGGARENVTMHARLVVGADGAHSVVARSFNLRRTRRWPRRLGLVAHVAGVPWTEEHGEMHVGPRGYVGVAPVGNDVVSVGLVRSLPSAPLGPAGPALDAALADYPELAARLGSGRRVGSVQGVGPLSYGVRAVAGAGFALVGDAAGTVDPFTGEGIFRALRGAEILADVAGRALADERDPIDLQPAYASARRAAFRSKERLTELIQVLVHAPMLLGYVLERLRRRPEVAANLGRVLGDLEHADAVMTGRSMWGLLRP